MSRKGSKLTRSCDMFDVISREPVHCVDDSQNDRLWNIRSQMECAAKLDAESTRVGAFTAGCGPRYEISI
jgi:hypothetical protein